MKPIPTLRASSPRCRLAALFGAVMVASLFFISPGARADNITWTIQSGVGQDWTLASGWSDQISSAASFAQNTNNTYEVLAGKRLRTPGGGDTSFPSSLAVSTDT